MGGSFRDGLFPSTRVTHATWVGPVSLTGPTLDLSTSQIRSMFQYLWTFHACMKSIDAIMIRENHLAIVIASNYKIPWFPLLLTIGLVN